MGRVRHGSRVTMSASYRLVVVALRPLLMSLTRRDWRGAEQLRVGGSLDHGIVVAVNHLSWFAPLVVSHFLVDNGRLPRFLAKDVMFRVPVVGRIVRGAGQIPVHRGTAEAAEALTSAVAAARAGECVLVYPEGTLTRSPGLWPMTGKSGAVRIALESGAPLVPVAQWGAHQVMRPYVKELRLFPRKTMRVWAGPPLDLDDLRGHPASDAELVDATERLMSAITGLLEQIRGEVAPTPRFAWPLLPPAGSGQGRMTT